jgi:aminoglycoside phosphotransferase
MLNNLLEICPPEIKKLLKNKKVEENVIGCENSKVYKIINEKGPDFYLKVKEKNPVASLFLEFQKTQWLKDKISVPEPLEYMEHENNEFYLMEEVRGKMSCQPGYFNNNEDVVRVMARTLKKLHGLEPENCPFNQNLAVKIKAAEYNMENNLVDESDFNPENMGKTSSELYKELLATVPDHEDIVMAHGDYCMPNIIINKNLFAGLIDLGSFGLADRYQDISLILRSMVKNFNTDKYHRLFLNEYGIKNLDQKKITFYKLLDEFF